MHIPKVSNLTGYFVIDRKNGISYDVISQGTLSLMVIPNKATNKRRTYIDLRRLLPGLSQRRYRLIPKTQPYVSRYLNTVTNVDPRFINSSVLNQIDHVNHALLP